MSSTASTAVGLKFNKAHYLLQLIAVVPLIIAHQTAVRLQKSQKDYQLCVPLWTVRAGFGATVDLHSYNLLYLHDLLGIKKEEVPDYKTEASLSAALASHFKTNFNLYCGTLFVMFDHLESHLPSAVPSEFLASTLVDIDAKRKWTALSAGSVASRSAVVHSFTSDALVDIQSKFRLEGRSSDRKGEVIAGTTTIVELPPDDVSAWQLRALSSQLC